MAVLLAAPDGEDRLSRLTDAVFRHWVPELEAPVAKVLREGKRLPVRITAADLLVSQASARKYLADALALIRSQPVVDQPKVYLAVFCRNLVDADEATWSTILKDGLALLRLIMERPHPRAAELAVRLADWLELKLPRFTVHADRPPSVEELAREGEAAIAGVLEWYRQHPDPAPGAARPRAP